MKCIYPYCKEEVIKPTNLQVGKIVDNEIELTKDTKDIYLCKYHSLLAKEGIIGLVNTDGLIRISGNLDIIFTIEKILKIKEEIKNGKV